ncbi:hypothetical protein HL653_16960 [Sphingomonas sp. AP4-R1]|nr:hypothetical protein [Sphingomonas sp. AP4-R1]QJU59227.1 hypothetical protein HL653_16960 [Sphingomonas sp. AP4-R1]
MDGVEIHAANEYLIDQYINSDSTSPSQLSRLASLSS